MYWTLELASYLSDAPWPATKDELIDFAIQFLHQWFRGINGIVIANAKQLS